MLDPILLISLCLFSVAVNLRVIFLVIGGGARKKISPIALLVAHLSSVGICYTFLALLYIADKWSLADLSWPGFCELLQYFGCLLYNAFPLNVISIIYESMRSSRLSSSSSFSIIKLMLFIWIPAGLGSIPVIFMVEYEASPERHMGRCKPVQLFGELSATVIYELFRFTAYYELVVGYMIYALMNIRSKLHCLHILQPIPNRRMRRKVQKIRYVCAHSIVFILLWTPVGILLLLHKSLRWSVLTLPIIKMGTRALVLTILIFFLLSPLIYVAFIENVSAAQFCFGECAATSGLPVGNGSRNQVGRNLQTETEAMHREVRINYLEMSRISTAGISSSVNSNQVGSGTSARVSNNSQQGQIARVASSSRPITSDPDNPNLTIITVTVHRETRL